jgi:hypothetical protein
MDQTWGMALNQRGHGLRPGMARSRNQWSEWTKQRIVYLRGYIPHAEAGPTCGDDEIRGLGGIAGPPIDRLTDELCVIRDDPGVNDTVAAGAEEVGCGRAGAIEELVR